MKPQIYSALIALLLVGCAVGPDYRQPNTKAPANWSEAQLAGTPVVEWWKTFNDPELDSLVERAVTANHDLRMATARLREARAQRGAAFWDLGPAINGKA